MLAVIYRRTCLSYTLQHSPAAKRMEEEDNKVVFVFPFLKEISCLCFLTVHSWGFEEGDKTGRRCNSLFKGVSCYVGSQFTVRESKRGTTQIVVALPFLRVFLVFVYSQLTVVYIDTHAMLHSHPHNLLHTKVKMLKENHIFFAFVLFDPNPTSL
jgi:hypothetical protein